MDELIEGRANSVIEMSLTELAFIFFFILLTFSVWKIDDTSKSLVQKNEEVIFLTERNNSLKESLDTAATYADLDEEYDPEKLFEELVLGQKAVQELQKILVEKEDLEEKLNQFTEAVGDIKDLELRNEQITDYKLMKEVLENNGFKDEKNPVTTLTDVVQQYSDIKGQNINLRNKLKNVGNGLDHPPCWPDPITGKSQYVFNVTINENSVVFKPGWLDSRSDQANSDPHITRVIGEYANIMDMKISTEELYNDSVRALCRHTVRIYDHSDSKKAFKKYLFGVEDHFYKYLSRTQYL